MTEQKKTRRQMLEEFVTNKPEDAFSRYGLAMECMNSGDPGAADAHFRALLEHNANYVPAYLMYAQLSPANPALLKPSKSFQTASPPPAKGRPTCPIRTGNSPRRAI
jgi:Tfp pilus assembly protein PilF